MNIFIEPSKDQWLEICKRPSGDNRSQSELVQTILSHVQSAGDQALREYALNFDQVVLENLRVSQDEFESAWGYIDTRLKKAMHIAKANIEAFHSAQIPAEIKVETMPGVECWQKAKPIERIGIYIPGGTAPLFSTVLMLAAPAKMAGCKEIVICTPPQKDGSIHPAILCAAMMCDTKQVYKIGGAQAIAAMAFGTESVPQVSKIFGPGNSFVTLAKMKVQQHGTAIDMPAGPSEVLVWADQWADPDFIAIDLLSQAEHGADSQVILVANDKSLLEKVNASMENLLKRLPRMEYAVKSLSHSGGIVLASEPDQIDFINQYAPEHLIIHCVDADRLAETIQNAGSIFIGSFSPESVGDYASGTNHTLPTSAFAKSYSGVNLDSFMKKITYQKLSKEGLQNIGGYVETMAEAEQLEAHKLAVTIRLNKLNSI